MTLLYVIYFVKIASILYLFRLLTGVSFQIVPENTVEAFKEATKYNHMVAFESDVTVRYVREYMHTIFDPIDFFSLLQIS